MDPASPGLSSTFTRPFVAQPGLTFTANEIKLIGRFNQLAGAPADAARVPGFTSGTSASPFQLELVPESQGASPKIVGGPLVAVVGTAVEFDAANPAGSVFWDFGDQTIGGSLPETHAYQAPGVYHVNLFSPADSITPQDTAVVVVLPAPGHAPARGKLT